MIILGRLVKRINRGTDVQLIFEVSKSFAEKRQGGGALNIGAILRKNIS